MLYLQDMFQSFATSAYRILFSIQTKFLAAPFDILIDFSCMLTWLFL